MISAHYLAKPLFPAHYVRMDIIPTSQAERELSELIHRASGGETIVLVSPSGERVRLQPLPAPALVAERVPGLLKDKFEIPARLLEPMTDEELKLWSGEEA